MNQKDFDNLLKFFEDNNIELKTNEYCHKCDNFKEEDLSLDWLEDRLKEEKIIKVKTQPKKK